MKDKDLWSKILWFVNWPTSFFLRDGNSKLLFDCSDSQNFGRKENKSYLCTSNSN